MKKLFFFAALLSVFATLGIFATLVAEAAPFFAHVSFEQFFTDSTWTPLFENPKFGISSLLVGTFVTTVIAMVVAIPIGTLIAFYLSEFCSDKMRSRLKPTLEVLAAIPTVVLGYFALLIVTPFLQRIFPDMGPFNRLSAGLVMGLMIIPYVASFSEDALSAVPASLREAAYALGSNKTTTCLRVLGPAAFSGISSAYILAASRALGETMIVAIAGGMQPSSSWNPLLPSSTVTAFIVQVSLGDLPHGSVGYQSIFAAGLVLAILTLMLNLGGHALKKRFREVYDG